MRASDRAVDVGDVAIVMPVHDEEALLEGSLEALAAAVRVAEARGIRCETRIVLDACTDGSAAIAARFAFPVVVCDARTVGAARNAGSADALRALGEGADDAWIAHTDADSTVPAEWLLDHIAVARRADVYLGTVRPDFDDLTPAHRALWLRTHVRGRPAGNVHGANLGIRASVFRAVGGFRHLAEHEDADLVARCRSAGAVVVASDAAEVQTSGRIVGRTPGGYAAFVRDTAAAVAAGGRLTRGARPQRTRAD